MPFELKVIAEPANATQCGGCAGVAHDSSGSGVCALFGHKPLVWTWLDPETPQHGDYGRLPECVEAEKRAREGA